MFSTAEDGQTAVDVKVFQGERPMAADNMILGEFRLEGIPTSPRGIPQIEVTFDIDANGILNVSAKDKATGKEQRISITASTNLNKNDIERMVTEAQKNAATDIKRKELAEARNIGDQTAYQAEKSLQELGEKVSGADRGRVEGQINDLRDALKTDDVTRIKKATEALQNASAEIYRASQSQASPGDSATDKPQEGGVVEGEYRAV